MGIFLTILKIAGIVLLSVLGVALLILILILFVPIRYRADAVIEETDLEKEASLILEKLTAKASFSWLLHIIRGEIAYPESKEFQLKVLCFTVYPPKNKKNENDENQYDNQYENHSESAINDDNENNEVIEESAESDSINTEDNSAEHGQSDSEEETREADKNESDEDPEVTDKNESDEEPAITDNNDSDDFDEEEEESARGFFEFLGDIFDVVSKVIRVPQDVFKKIQYTISRIYAKINMVKNTLSNDIFKRAFEVTKKQVFRVLRMILPRIFRADFLVGTNDPTVTADIFAAYGILYPIVVNKVFVTPEFERPVLAGKAHLKGRITVFTIVWAAAIIYFNKDCRKTYRRFRKIIDS